MGASSLFRGPHTLAMGILNVTPDSFSDGGLFLDPQRALRHARWLIEDGADLLDIGGESTRPGAGEIPVEDELARVRPVLEGLLPDCRVPLSIDTRKPEVADACLAMGARILNDVGGLRDPRMREVAARHGASVVIMHMQGNPQTMQDDPRYGNVVAEVCDWLAARVEEARRDGITDIAIDPGIGFGKTAGHNFALLAHLEHFQQLGLPLLLGPSRKRFLSAIGGMRSPQERLEGTIAACVAATLAGASVLRVHDVAECVRAMRVADAIVQARRAGPAMPANGEELRRG